MRFYKELYVGEEVKNLTKKKINLKIGKGFLNFYIITLAQNDDQLNIFKASQLKQKLFDKKSLKIVGIANNYNEAVQLVVQITQDIYKQTGNANIKQFFAEKM